MHRLHQRQEGEVEAQDLVFGMVGDPGDLVGVQARVDGVQHAAAAAHAVVQLQVPVAVPGQRGNAVAEEQLLPVQRIGHLPGTRCDSAPRGAVDIAFDAARDDLAVAVVALDELDQRRDQKRLVLHQTQHLQAPSFNRIRWFLGLRRFTQFMCVRTMTETRGLRGPICRPDDSWRLPAHAGISSTR
jgi:hypothetical protein